MKHKKAKKRLTQYLSGLLSNKQHKEIASHISACEECRNEINTLNNMITVIKKRPTVKLSSREFERIKLRVRVQEQEKMSTVKKEDLRILSPIFVISFILFFVSTILIGGQITKELTSRQILFVAFFIYIQVTGILAFLLVLFAKKEKLRSPWRFIRNLKTKKGFIK